MNLIIIIKHGSLSRREKLQVMVEGWKYQKSAMTNAT